jgi:predicted HicB family RNase H-like nuclease
MLFRPELDDHTLTVRISGQLRDVLYEAATESRHSLNSIVTIFLRTGIGSTRPMAS